jgi:hypothetical protein
MNAKTSAADALIPVAPVGQGRPGAALLRVRFQATAHSEWIKFRSLRSGPAALSATAVVVLLGAWLVSSGYRSGWAQMSPGDKASFDPVYTGLRGIELAQLFVGALGVMMVTGEYTSGLIRGTFIATPQRVQVLTMKALIFTSVVWAWCTAVSFAAFLISGSFLTSPVPHVVLGDPGVPTAVFGGGLYLAFVGLLGLFIGVLVRRTPAALAALFGILLVVPVAAGMVPGTIGARVAEVMPGAAGEQIWKLRHDGQYEMGPWVGFGLLVAYVAVTAAAALILVRRRDA